MNIYVRPDGTSQAIYDEKLDLTQIGAIDIKRASHVEPDPEWPGKWYSDLSPVGGPVLRGFLTRTAALAAEIAWLEQQLAQRPLVAQEAG